MTSSSQTTPDEGVRFASIDGSRSSQRAGKAIFADSVRAVDADLANRIERSKDWRKGYIDRVRDLVVAGAQSAKNASRIAADGLDSVSRNLAFARGGQDVPLRDAMRSGDASRLHAVVVEGTGERITELAVPHKGRVLRGDDLLRQLERWEADGIIEPSARDAVTQVVRNPAWLDLSDQYFALLGTASEMGPYEALTSWGANIVAFDLPRRHLWEQITSTARKGSGRVHAIATTPVASPEDVIDKAGVDLMTDAPDVGAWLRAFEHPFTIGNYVYADGANFVRLAAAVDAMIAELIANRPDVALAYLATPTDVFAVPEETVVGANARAKRTIGSTILAPLSASKLYHRSYRDLVDEEGGRKWGIADCLVPIQGANYALAKSMQRWRATVAREEGTRSSANVAPATKTKSVVKNRMLAAAYGGAHRFGVDIFAPETSRVLMAALLVHDVRNPGALSNPETPIDHPFELFAQGAVHGGLWRSPYEPRSVLPLALLIGLVKRR
jgi:hypothetical protein